MRVCHTTPGNQVKIGNVLEHKGKLVMVSVFKFNFNRCTTVGEVMTWLVARGRRSARRSRSSRARGGAYMQVIGGASTVWCSERVDDDGHMMMW